MNICGSSVWSFSLPAVFLAAVVVALVSAPTVAYAEGLAITGAQLRLVHGGLEDAIRYPDYLLSNHGESRSYNAPKVGDIVRVLDEYDQFEVSGFWPKITFFWEDCGAKAEFDYRDHLGYLNGHVFAIMLSNAATWEWLGKATEADLAGVRFIEVQGVPPADFAPLLARLPKRKIVVRCGEVCFASLPNALLPLEPVGLMVLCTDDRNPPDLRMFSSCVFLDADLRGVTTIQLPPSLKALSIHCNPGSISEVQGSETSLEAITLFGVRMFSNWIPDYRALKEVVIPYELNDDGDCDDLAKALVQLPVLQLLMFAPKGKDMSFLSSLKKLKALRIMTAPPDISAVSKLAELEFLSIGLPCSSDASLLSAPTNLKFLDLSFIQEVKRANQVEGLDLDDLAPIQERITCLKISGFVRLFHPERLSSMTALEELRIGISSDPGISLNHLSSLINLKVLTGLRTSGQDLTLLTKLPRLETLGLWLDASNDLSCLKGCASLRTLSIESPSRLRFAELAELTSLTKLNLTMHGVPGKGDGEAGDDLGCGALSNLKGLRFLSLNVSGLKSVEFLDSLESLSGLDFWNFAGTDLTVLGRMKALRYLRLGGLPNLDGASAIRLPRSLSSLVLQGGYSSDSLAFLDGAEGLATLDISEFPEVTALPKLAAPLKRLTSLRIMNCSNLTDTSGLASMPALESLIIGNCPFTELAGFGELRSLREMILRTKRLEHLPKVAPEAPLVQAAFWDGRSLLDLDGLETWCQIRDLALDIGKQIEDIAPLASLSHLSSLRLTGGDAILAISPLMKMTWLKTLDIRQSALFCPANIELLEKSLPGCRIVGKQ